MYLKSASIQGNVEGPNDPFRREERKPQARDSRFIHSRVERGERRKRPLLRDVISTSLRDDAQQCGF